jgi:L-ribulokinase
MKHYSIGLDFGTESARAILVDTANGNVIASSVSEYQDGVINNHLPSNNNSLPPNFALQNSANWLSAAETTIQTIMREADIQPKQVIGIGVDFTSSTILPTKSDGTPLHTIKKFANRPHAWPKLWKHHAAHFQAERMTELALRMKLPWLDYYGGKISSEWLPPKALQVLEEDQEIYEATDVFVEGGDWLVWNFTNRLTHNTCAAGYKALWHKGKGFPSEEYLAQLNPHFRHFYKKLSGKIVSPGTKIGELNSIWAVRLGLKAGTPIAAAIIDAHSAAIGGGVTQPNILYMIMGTSTCHLLMTEEMALIPGISGAVEDGIVPNLIGYEAGQVSVGDSFAWFINNCLPPAYINEANDINVSPHKLLTDKASKLNPGKSGLLALDWWNGNRTPFVDADLSGVILGYSLLTKPEEIYRALIESTAFGSRLIIEIFTNQGINVNSIVVGGGLVKNEMLLQIYADVTQRNISVSSSPQVSALGAAILAAVAAGREAGGYDNINEAASHMVPPPLKVYSPDYSAINVYDDLYKEYLKLGEYFGSGENLVMKTLRNIQRSK